MGLLARHFEESGLPTVSLSSALDITTLVKPPRALFVNFPLGNQCGRPGDPPGQRAILQKALSLLETARAPEIATWPEPWRPDDPSDGWEEEVARQGLEA